MATSNNNTQPGHTLVVITGATASGKTSVAIDVARALGCEIISADSRQVYKDLPIGTAAPTPEQRAAVPHHLVGFLGLDATYNASAFSDDVAALLPHLWQRSPYAVMVGGSMLYIDAVTDGIDVLPDVPPDVRNHVTNLIATQGLDAALDLLGHLDPEYRARVDAVNPRRVARGLEIALATGQPYSSMTGHRRTPDYNIIKLAIDIERPQLFDNINRRVRQMIDGGMLDEARRFYEFRSLNSLNTIGYKELFTYLDGAMTLDEAAARIAKNTRVYAKKQLTWLARPTVRPSVRIAPDPDQALSIIKSVVQERV